MPAVSAEYPECWVEVPYAQEPKQQAQAPTIAHGARGAREEARRAQSVTALAEELAAVDIEDVLKPDVFTVDDLTRARRRGWRNVLACPTSCGMKPAQWSTGRGSRRSSGTRAASVVGIVSMQ